MSDPKTCDQRWHAARAANADIDAARHSFSGWIAMRLRSPLHERVLSPGFCWVCKGKLPYSWTIIDEGQEPRYAPVEEAARIAVEQQTALGLAQPTAEAGAALFPRGTRHYYPWTCCETASNAWTRANAINNPPAPKEERDEPRGRRLSR